MEWNWQHGKAKYLVLDNTFGTKKEAENVTNIYG